MSGTSGSSGFGSVNIEQIDKSTVERKSSHISDRWSSNCKRNDKRTLGDCKCWRPLVPQNVKADRPISIDVGVVDLGGEADFRRLEWIIRWEGN